MPSAATYNRKAIGRIWNLRDLPEEWPAYAILLQGDLDKDMVIEAEELDEIDWISFSEAVGDFQEQAGVEEPDSKLGPETLKLLRKHYRHADEPDEVLKKVADLILKKAEIPVSEPSGPPMIGKNAEERRVCNLWNNYGGALISQASRYAIPITTALAVFYVESGTAYDPTTGLIIIRFEPHIFKKKSGTEISWGRDGQRMEWQNFERAYDRNGEAALLSTSYGLPQLMGFNYRVTPYPNAREMVLAFQRSCEEQIAGFFGFVESNNLVSHILNEDWRAFTRGYNGPGNVDDYSGKLIRALKVIESLEEDGAEFK